MRAGHEAGKFKLPTRPYVHEFPPSTCHSLAKQGTPVMRHKLGDALITTGVYIWPSAGGESVSRDKTCWYFHVIDSVVLILVLHRSYTSSCSWHLAVPLAIPRTVPGGGRAVELA